jgi:hypothetical protein
MLNRGALIVRPKQPYLDWAAGLDDSGLLPDPAGEQTVYLIPGYEEEGELAELLEVLYEEIFERELFGWHMDESAWPKKRTYAMFQEWFTIETHSMVEDLSADELVDDDEVEDS